MRREIGKGLSQLIGEQYEASASEAPIDSIVPNARQPRTHFAEQPLQELAASIKQFGVLQPLIVTPLDEKTYELIAGERRLRAAKMAGLKSVPIVIRASGGQSSLEIAIIENVQREDINPVEAAKAYRRLIDEFNLTQEQVADRVGKSRTAITNTLRLLKLPRRILDGLQAGEISEGHARALLAVEDEVTLGRIYEEVVQKGLSVRSTEKAAKKKSTERPAPARRRKQKEASLYDFEQQLSEKLGAPVQIGGGEITIEYFSEEDLERILEQLGLSS